MGNLDFIAELGASSTVIYSVEKHDGEMYIAKFIFAKSTLTVSEENWVGMFGMNVMFSGDYTRVP